MDIQDYIPVKEEKVVHHYSEDRIKPANILPTLLEEEYDTTTGSSTPVRNEASSSQQQDNLNPALLLNRYDKRKSSPAILGLPFGLNHEAQLSLHLSHQRNSIEAAMLLANFNKLLAFPKANETDHKGNVQKKNMKKKGGRVIGGYTTAIKKISMKKGVKLCA